MGNAWLVNQFNGLAFHPDRSIGFAMNLHCAFSFKPSRKLNVNQELKNVSFLARPGIQGFALVIPAFPPEAGIQYASLPLCLPPLCTRNSVWLDPESSYFVPLYLCAFVPLFLCAFVPSPLVSYLAPTGNPGEVSLTRLDPRLREDEPYTQDTHILEKSCRTRVIYSIIPCTNQELKFNL